MSEATTTSGPPHKGALRRYRLLADAYRPRSEAPGADGARPATEYLYAGEVIEVFETSPVSKYWIEVDSAGEPIVAPELPKRLQLPETDVAERHLTQVKATVQQAMAERPGATELKALTEQLAERSKLEATSTEELLATENMRRRLTRMEHDAATFEERVRPLLVELKGCETEVRLCRLRDLEDQAAAAEEDLVRWAKDCGVEAEERLAELDRLCNEVTAIRDQFTSGHTMSRLVTVFHGVSGETALERVAAGMNSIEGHAMSASAGARTRGLDGAPRFADHLAFLANAARRKSLAQEKVVTKLRAERVEREQRARERRRRQKETGSADGGVGED